MLHTRWSAEQWSVTDAVYLIARLSFATWLLGEHAGIRTAWPRPLGSGRRMGRGLVGSPLQAVARPLSPRALWVVPQRAAPRRGRDGHEGPRWSPGDTEGASSFQILRAGTRRGG